MNIKVANTITYELLTASSLYQIGVFFIHFKGSPNLSILVDDNLVNGSLLFEVNKTYVVVCRTSDDTPLLLQWLINKRQVENDTNSGTWLSLYQSSSVLSKRFSLEGTLTCMSRFHRRVGPRVDIKYSTLDLSIAVNGNSNSTNILMEERETIKAVCMAEIGMTSVKLAWNFSNSDITIIGEEEHVFCKNYTMLKCNYQVSVNFTFLGEEITLTCYTTGTVQFQVHRDVFIKTYVFPEVYVLVNGKTTSQVSVRKGRQLLVVCQAIEGRPQPRIRWIIDNRVYSAVIKNTTVTVYNNTRNTFTATAVLGLIPNASSGSIQCEVEVFEDVSKVFEYSFIIQDTTVSTNVSGPTTTPTFVIITTLLIAIVFAAFTCGFLVQKRRRPPFQLHTQARLLGKSFQKQGGIGGEHARLQLPEIPQTVEVGYTTVSEYYEVEYAHAVERSDGARIFPLDTMCFILEIKSGDIYRRWMGTINVSNSEQKSVLISTVADKTLKTNDISWGIYIKKILEMNRHDNLVQVLGICTDSKNMYLIHENIPGGTLRDKIKFRKLSEDESRLKECANGVLKGMEILHTNGFLHPGISSRKILLAEQGTCKLYDFCLKQDAPRRLVSLKSKEYSPDDFPPETVSLNEYSSACDVWCTALVISELFTYGITSSEKESAMEETNLSAPQKDLLKSCWREESLERPTISKLLATFSSTGAKVAGVSEPFQNVGSEGYVPMKANTNPKEEYVYHL